MAIKVRVHAGNNWLKDAGYTLEQEKAIYDEQLQDIIDNPRWYLDRLESMVTYRVSWVPYNLYKITIPYGFVKKTVRRKVK